jgi:o-succinylbenzoate synthase
VRRPSTDPGPLSWGTLDLPLARPLPVRGRSLARRSVLRLHLGASALSGAWSEAAPLPGLHAETCSGLERWLAAHHGRVTRALEHWLGQAPDPRQPPLWPGHCPPSLALALDLLAQAAANARAGRPAWQLPGLSCSAIVPLAPLLAGESLPALPEAGPRELFLKVKLVPGRLPGLFRILCDLQGRLADRGRLLRLRLDGNRALDQTSLALLVPWARDLSIQWLEDPCLTIADSRAACGHLGLDLALDEFLPLGADETGIEAWLVEQRPAAIVLKPSLAGGIRPLALWCEAARRQGITAVFSSCYESPWALGRLAAWAALLAPDTAHGLGTGHFFHDTGGRNPRQPAWTLTPACTPDRPAHGWHTCRSWHTGDPGLGLQALPGLGRLKDGPSRALALPLFPGGAWPPAGSRVDCRRSRTQPGNHAAGKLLELLDRGCSVFPQDPGLPGAEADARARGAGCDTRLDLATGRWWPLVTEEPGPRIPGQGPWVLLATGGSSGRPRIVCHSLRSLLAGASGALEASPFGPGDHWLLALPVHHAGGLSVLFRCLLGGGLPVLPRPGETLVSAVVRHCPSHFSLVPTQLADLLEHEGARQVLRQGRLVLVGGAPLPEALRRQALAAGLPLAPSWGLTETGGQVCTALPGTWRTDGRSGSGRVLPGRELRVCKGELQMRGPALCEGWIEGSVFHRAGGPAGWFATGDLGRIDVAGEVRVLGRRQRLLISGGENLYPDQIEGQLVGHPAVRRACILAVPDMRWGQRPVAVLELAPGHGLPADWPVWLAGCLPRVALPDRCYRWPADLTGFKTPWGELSRRLERGELEGL